ncbi:uncharacterized protein N7484_002381 [Penicillium longicatenatum]|uniref:uncharacterized protein n=1 Tax=Penicillium longicatenatum TaxID=1561947 RepID=UPI002548DF64|nr:uncharacterized protein N7484_002381 [Penicillium longicatenatum]KAJ5658732.1 hypothetical protein N7484_002381 [Penicillium longicatenatum]
MALQTQILDDPLFDNYVPSDFLPITQYLVPSDVFSDEHIYENDDADIEGETKVAPLFTQNSIGLNRFDCPSHSFTSLKVHQDDELESLLLGV